MAVIATTFALTAVAMEVPAEIRGKTVTYIVPYGAGGQTDITARYLAKKIEDRTGVQIIVKNVVGAGGVIGTNALVSAAADGLTWAQLESQSSIVNSLLAVPSAHDITKIKPAAMINQQAAGIMVRREFPASNLAEFVAYARAHSGKMTYANVGVIYTIWNNSLFGAIGARDMVTVAYKSSAESTRALLGGEVDFYLMPFQEGLPLVADGRVKWIALGSRQRMPQAADLPTVAESYPGVFFDNFQATFVPAATPDHIVRWINHAMTQAILDSESQQWFASRGMIPVPGDTAHAARLFDVYVKERQQAVEKFATQLNVKKN